MKLPKPKQSERPCVLAKGSKSLQMTITVTLALRGDAEQFANLFGSFSFDHEQVWNREILVYRLAQANKSLTCPVRYNHREPRINTSNKYLLINSNHNSAL